jgi:predicted alpha/beta superfamily hydrolase
MKLPLFALFALILAPFGAYSVEANATASFPHVVLENTEIRPLHSEITGRDYLLYVAYPNSYASQPDRKFPVVYVTDGYWNFVKTQSLGPNLWYDQVVPEYIVVGIGYQGENVPYEQERLYELTPTASAAPQHVGQRMGGSRAFLDAFKKEIIPYVEANIRADASFRVLAGTSLGGLFCLYAMYEEPELFQGIVCSTPAVLWDDRWLFRREMELKRLRSGPSHNEAMRIPTRLFMCAADKEWPVFDADILAFDQIIKNAGYMDFAYQFRMIDGERHGGNVAEAYNRGIRFVFEPMMPSPVMP